MRYATERGNRPRQVSVLWMTRPTGALVGSTGESSTPRPFGTGSIVENEGKRVATKTAFAAMHPK